MKAWVWIAAAILGAALAGCGPAGKTVVGKTTTGKRTYNTEWQRIPPKQVLINVEDLDNARVTRAEERLRDNAIVQ